MTPPNTGSSRASGFKQRALEELKVFWLTALYLWIFLGSFTVYRRLVLAETGVTYLHYGIALIEALVIAKVVLVGRMAGFGRRFDQQPLIVAVAYKSMVFGLLVLLFSVLEHVVEAMIRHHSALSGLRDLASLGVYELSARVLMITLAFMPFFAFWEIGRVVGMQRLAALFFQKQPTSFEDQPRLP
ncbi:conserved membrane protein of unknown function [Cyanobium sp. NIES-981]|nr:conserved membrane protein of unknown function [Cyanobium sp. NIES-981]